MLSQVHLRGCRTEPLFAPSIPIRRSPFSILRNTIQSPAMFTNELLRRNYVKLTRLAESRNKEAGRISIADLPIQHGSQFLFKAQQLNKMLTLLSINISSPEIVLKII